MEELQNNVNRSAAGDTSPAIQRLAQAVVNTDEFREILNAFVPEVINKWAGKNIFKRIMGTVARRSIIKGFKKDKDVPDEPIASLLQDPQFIRRAAAGLPENINAAAGLISSLLSGINNIPSGDKVTVLKGFFEKTNLGEEIGKVLTGLFRLINEIHGTEPLFFSRQLLPGIKNWIEATDFGELKDFVDGSTDDIVALVSGINEELWEYPAKVVCLLSLIPTVLNIAMDSLSGTLGPINDMPPDLLADVLLSALHECDGRKVGRFINQLNEVIRKLHTGSTLIGDEGKPKIPAEVSRFLASTIQEVDIPLLFKARSLASEIKRMATGAFIGLLEEYPELAKEYFQSGFKSAAANIRDMGARADALERIFSNDELAEGFAAGITEIDAPMLGDIISRVCAQLNDIRHKNPGLIAMTLTEMINSMDSCEAGETVRWFVDDITASIKPIAPEVVPPVIRGIAKLLSPEEYGDPGELEDALALLRKAINGKEAAV